MKVSVIASEPFLVALEYIVQGEVARGRPPLEICGLLVGTAAHFAGLSEKDACDISDVFTAKLLSVQAGGAS